MNKKDVEKENEAVKEGETRKLPDEALEQVSGGLGKVNGGVKQGHRET